MRPRLRIALFVLLGLALCGLTWRLLSQPRRVYSGKPLNYWLAQMRGLGPQPMNFQIQLGTNTLPVLILALQKHDGLAERMYFRIFLKLPSFLRRNLPMPPMNELVRFNAARVLHSLDLDAKPAVPTLLRASICDESPTVQRAAQDCIFHLGLTDESVVAALIADLNDKDLRLRTYATNTLKTMAPEAALHAGIH